MAFSTPTFLIFFALTCCGWFALPQKLKNPFLLLASMVFYGWAMPAYCAVVLGTAGFGYLAARFISSAQSDRRCRVRLASSIVLLVAILVLFKYLNFFASVFAAVFGGEAATLSLAQPLGISYYTLRLVGYLVDVYRGDEPERNFVDFALFVSFFPQVISGPVGRSCELLPQFKQRHDFDYYRAVSGLERFLWGAFKKVVIADSLSVLVNGIYADLASYTGAAATAVIVLYTVQLYCDFSGYTDMALGSARVLGFTLEENFNAPFTSCGIGDFWSRWHMSLTNWLRDYVYFPLGGSRRGFARKLLNVVIIFLISGLWHGAGYTYLAWGLWNALFRILEELLGRALGERFSKPRGIVRALRIAATNLIFAFGLVIFRAPTLSDALTVVKNALLPPNIPLALEQISYLATQNVSADRVFILFFFGVIAAGLALVAAFGSRMRRRTLAAQPDAGNPLGGLKPAVKWALCIAMGLCVMFFFIIGATRGAQSASFIYGGF